MLMKTQYYFFLKTHASLTRKLTRYLFKQSSQKREEFQVIMHFDKHTASLFIQNITLTRKLTSYVV